MWAVVMVGAVTVVAVVVAALRRSSAAEPTPGRSAILNHHLRPPTEPPPAHRPEAASSAWQSASSDTASPVPKMWKVAIVLACARSHSRALCEGDRPPADVGRFTGPSQSSLPRQVNVPFGSGSARQAQPS